MAPSDALPFPLLHTPEQHSHTNPAVQTQPKELRKWLESLALYNPAVSLAEMNDALGAFNSQRLDARTRARLLETYRPYAATAFAASDPGHLRGLPLSGAQRHQVRADASRLVDEWANACKLLVKEAHANTRQRSDLLPLAMARAGEATAWRLLHAFRHHASPSKHAYRELHQLHHFAWLWSLAARAPRLDRFPPAQPLADSYRHILLTATLDPYHLPAGSATAMFDAIGTAARACELRLAERPKKTGPFLWVIDHHADAAPVPWARARILHDKCWLLDTQPAIAYLRSELNSAQTFSDLEPPQVQLLRQVVPAHDGPRDRSEGRAVCSVKAGASIGLQAACRLIDEGVPANDAQGDAAASTGIAVSFLDGETDEPLQVLRAEVADQSERGCRLRCDRLEFTEAPVGELLTWWPAQDPAKLTLALVRWMRAAGAQQAELGCEHLPGDPLTAQWRDEEKIRPAVLLAPAIKTGQAPRLLLPHGSYSAEREISLTTSRSTLNVRLNTLLARSEHLDAVAFQTLPVA